MEETGLQVSWPELVLAVGFCGSPALQAAARKSPRGPGKLVGIVTAKTDKEITIKTDGEDEAKSYLLAPQGGAQARIFRLR